MTKSGDTKLKPIASINTVYQHAHATGADAVITLPIGTVAGKWVIYGLSFGYDDDPSAGGRLTIAGGGFNYSWPIEAAGMGWIAIPPSGHGQESDMTSDIVITLAGVTDVRGDLNVHAEIA